MSSIDAATEHPQGLTATGRYLILTAAFLGWMFSGVQLTLMNLANGSALTEFAGAGTLDRATGIVWERMLPVASHGASAKLDGDAQKELVTFQRARWYARFNCGFLLGAAFGGLVFGWIGDRFGRVKAMGLSIVCYSLFAGASYFVVTPEQLLAMRFVSAIGVGGMWPAGVSLASEAWSDVSRPMLSGLIGTAANVGIVIMSAIALWRPITPEAWRWIMLVAATPMFLGIVVWFVVPESPSWKAAQARPQETKTGQSLWSVFRPPLLQLTLLGIALGAIPLLGGWGVTSWLIDWSDRALGTADPSLKAKTSILRAGGGAVGSLLGGWIANLLGRRLTYFLISISTLAISEYIFFSLAPGQSLFLPFVLLVGFVSTIFFGWLPLYLPELFPTEARSTGTGVSFNFGRILTAFGVLGTGWLTSQFNNDYAAAGRVTSLVYALGMIVILFAPDTSKRKLGG